MLPAAVGVRVQVRGLLGSIDAPGFSKEDGAYVNAAYGSEGPEVRVAVTGGIGSVNLRLAD